MHCQDTRPPAPTPIDRPTLVCLARALECALDNLPRHSAWQAPIDRLHEHITHALEPDWW
jgi:hypothetical protein